MVRETTSVRRVTEDRLFGTLCIKEGYVTPIQLEEALALQKQAPPGTRKVGQILVERGHLTDQQLHAILEIQRREVKPLIVDPTKGGLFGQIALDQGYVTAEQLDECLGEQQVLSRGGSPMMIGQILLRKGHLQTDQFLQILKIQRNRVLRCPGCDTFYKVEPEDEGEKFACRRCGTIIRLPVPETIADGITPATLTGLPPLAARPGAGAQIGRYVILEELGRGGMGIVYKALHKDLNKTFAVKVLRETEFSSNEMLTRFRREAQAAARLKHPNIVAIHDAGEEAGIHYIVMDAIEGDPLTVHLARRFKMRDMIVRFEKIVRALQHAHEQGIIHRDLKPANIMIDHAGEPHVMDFGLAKFIDRPQSIVTRAGAFLGTPYYMAPEQIRHGSEKVDARSDVYSLGVILYEIICGRTPHAGQNSVEVFNRILVEDPPLPREFNAKVHPDLQTICLKAIEKQAPFRYQSAAELADDLRRYLDGEPIHARPVSWPVRLLKRARKNKNSLLAAASLVTIALSLLALGGFFIRDAGEFQRLLGDGIRRFEGGDYREALSRFEAARRLRPGHPELENWLGLARARLDGQTEEENRRRLREEQRRQAEPKILDAAAILDQLPQEIVVERMTTAQIAERCGAVEKLLEEALRIAEHHEEAYYLRGRARELRGDASGAIEDFTRALGHAPRHFNALFERARLHLRRVAMAGNLSLRPEGFPPSPAAAEDRAQAASDFKAAWTWLREPRRASFARAALSYLDRRLAESAATLDTHLDRYPADVEALRLRAVVRLALADPARAEEDLSRAVRYHPADPGLWIWKGVVLAVRKDWTGAEEAMGDAIRTGPGDPAPWCARGKLRLERARYEEAAADFRRAAELAPAFSEAFAGAGSVRLRQENAGEAIISLTRAIQLEPRDPWPFVLRADALAALGKPADALGDADSAVALVSDSAAVFERRGLLLYRLERYEGALKDFDKALNLDPTAQVRLEAAVRAAKDKLGRP